MAKLTREFPVTIGFRATKSDAKKLAALAELTGRGQGEVLRLLLKQAMVREIPDIQLVEPLNMAIAAAKDAEHVN
jgi:hypothetical protein